MKVEDIEKAAQEESGRWATTPLHIQDIYRRDDFEAGFHSGVEWVMYKIWHNADEVPKKKGYILVEVNGGQPIFVTWNINVVPINWDKIVKENNVVKWVYVEDLIPDKED